MKHGDFTELAKFYVDRPRYSESVLNCIQAHIILQQEKEDLIVADVGAGTGKLTENLMHLKRPMRGYAIEPNDAMREEGCRIFSPVDKIVWQKGSAEQTGLAESSVDWVLMLSLIHI